jgi:hypothetical protein
MLLERMIRHIQQFDGVWWATLEEIAEYCSTVENLERWTPPNLQALARH